MKHLKIYEEFDDHTFPEIILKYKKGDYVKYTGNKRYLFKINDVDKYDFYKPYLIHIHDDPDALIVGNNYWVKESELYTDEETVLYTNQNKFNL